MPARGTGKASPQPARWLRHPAASSPSKQHPSPTACLFICHTLRCGSTLLCDLLTATGIAGSAEEYFPERLLGGELFVATGAALTDPETWRCDWSRAPFEQCLNHVVGCGTTPNGVFAAKVKWRNMLYLGDALAQDGLTLASRLERLFPNLRYLWVTRRDKVRQAVSLVRARQSQQWVSLSPTPAAHVAVDYNFHLVDLELRRIIEEERAWDAFFTHIAARPVTVVYEDLARAPEASVRKVLDACGIHLPSDRPFPAPRVRKQAEAISDAWVESYRRDVRSRRRWHTAASLPALLLRRRLRTTYVFPRLRAQIDDLRSS